MSLQIFRKENQILVLISFILCTSVFIIARKIAFSIIWTEANIYEDKDKIKHHNTCSKMLVNFSRVIKVHTSADQLEIYEKLFCNLKNRTGSITLVEFGVSESFSLLKQQ